MRTQEGYSCAAVGSAMFQGAKRTLNSKQQGDRMPDIRLYADMEHFMKHKKLNKEQKKVINEKARKVLYRELDKL